MEAKQMTTETGGPAFPRVGEGFGNPRYDAPGMDLRDYFAANAMAAALVSDAIFTSAVEGTVSEDDNDICERAYEIADAMIAARAAAPK